MLRTASSVALFLVTTFLPNAYLKLNSDLTPRPTQDDELEISREDRFFAKALYDRIDSLLGNKHASYYEPYAAIKIKEYQIKQQLDEIEKKTKEAEQRVNLKKDEEEDTKKALKRAQTPEEVVTISKRLERIERERRSAEQDVTILRTEKQSKKDFLQGYMALHFVEAQDLKTQSDRVNKQKMELFYRYADWTKYDTYKHYVALKDYLLRTATTLALMCNVSIRSERGSAETTGATIKYQTPEQRQFGKGLTTATTAKCPTACSEEMKPNKYYIWTERNNKPSSDTEKLYVITGERDSVRLQESPE